jgi:hypothetical protein
LDRLAEIVTNTKNIALKDDETLLKVNLRGDPDILKSELERIVKSLDISDEYQLSARYQPSRPMKRIRLSESGERGATGLGNLTQFRETFLLTEKMKHKDVASHLGWLKIPESDFIRRNAGNLVETKKDYEKYVKSILRRIERHRKFVLDAFKNVETGTFP